MGSIHEKARGRQSRATVPVKEPEIYIYIVCTSISVCTAYTVSRNTLVNLWKTSGEPSLRPLLPTMPSDAAESDANQSFIRKDGRRSYYV
jgi:hypothetical protein